MKMSALMSMSGGSSSSYRIITHLIRLLPVPPPRSTSTFSRPFFTSHYLERRRVAATLAEGEDTSSEQQPTVKKRRRRLDEVCLERFPEYSRNVIQSWIAQGKVCVDDRVVLKAGTPVPATATVVITAEQPKFVCRAGLKLESALDHFKIDPTGMLVLDSGLSTGGFTDCLLQRGARRVIGVDVGYGQVAEKVRVDPRVAVMERTNLRHLGLSDIPTAGALVDLVTLDLSFISSLKMRDTVCGVLKPEGGQLLLLIKPQFEAGRGEVNTGGVVRDADVRAKVVSSVIEGWKEVGFECSGWIESPIRGATAGNIEYLAHFVRRGGGGVEVVV